MNIEPCILLLRHTAKRLPAVWATLLDFLCLIARHFDPKRSSRIADSVTLGFQQALRLGVIASMRDILPRGCDGRLERAFAAAFPRIAPAAAAEKLAQESARSLEREIL